ncbi:MAG: dTMP kinase [Planctomycetia bacterium]|nr:dTMP kinase [Planctomycetia bacterium]
MFFALDGIDGGGKSTQVELLAEHLRAKGRDVVTCRDPGSTSLGEALRGILLNRRTTISRRAEMLLYMAARAQLVEEIISPALLAGKSVVSDRFLLSNVVYQGHAGGLAPDEIWEIGRRATKGLEPDLTFVLDVSLDEAQKRTNRPLDHMESQGDDYRRKLREGFLQEAARRPDKIVVIDARASVEEVHAAIRAAVEKLTA